MTLGPVMLDLAGPELTPEERDLLAHPNVGGVILFSRNYQAPEQLQALTAEIHAIRQPELVIAVDQEGGRVQRFREGFTPLPAMHALGHKYDLDPEQGLHLAEHCGWLMAAELRAAGVDLSFAPVLDLDYGLSEVIGDRAFHRDPAVVGRLAGRFAAGMRRAGMAAVGKHFPGHGGVAADSHVALPEDRRPYADLLDDMRPYETLIEQGLGGVMVAHVVYSRLDRLPAGFSRWWLNNELRIRLRFQGAVFSDDLSMAGAAVAGGPAERARLALEAGCDVVLVCNDRASAVQVVESLGDWYEPAGHLRLARLRGRGTMAEGLQASAEWRRTEALVREFEDERPRLVLEGD
ncbi:beta-N-acetylhexosaminidase [Thioalkalivibrio sp. XN8]|uniref:beta-N-acetylhexosaminidase n=1 Tax=Thioalkalivibrio sp. XN8 TaxID=2712863 RepID=UPI0013EDFE47|nr:beta-N-acetylhexosaminidase [Thioalkalivibrio sp. XN8]